MFKTGTINRQSHTELNTIYCFIWKRVSKELHVSAHEPKHVAPCSLLLKKTVTSVLFCMWLTVNCTSFIFTTHWDVPHKDYYMFPYRSPTRMAVARHTTFIHETDLVLTVLGTRLW